MYMWARGLSDNMLSLNPCVASSNPVRALSSRSRRADCRDLGSPSVAVVILPTYHGKEVLLLSTII